MPRRCAHVHWWVPGYTHEPPPDPPPLPSPRPPHQPRRRATAAGAKLSASDTDDSDFDADDAADLAAPELSDYFELWVAFAAWLAFMYGALRLSSFRARLFDLPVAVLIVSGAPCVMVGVVYMIDVLRHERALARRSARKQAPLARSSGGEASGRADASLVSA